MSITSEISRRQFIGGVAAFGSSSLFMPALCSESEDEPLIRFGVASDVHILADWRDANCRDLDRQPEYLEKALRWFDSQRADAVVFSGDMAHTGRVAELERLAAVWDRVFPGGRAAGRAFRMAGGIHVHWLRFRGRGHARLSRLLV